MRFNKISQYVIYCDFCDSFFVYDGHRLKEAINDAREEGWKIGKKVTCKDCLKYKNGNK